MDAARWIAGLATLIVLSGLAKGDIATLSIGLAAAIAALGGGCTVELGPLKITVQRPRRRPPSV
jgi:hypothetical protein